MSLRYIYTLYQLSWSEYSTKYTVNDTVIHSPRTCWLAPSHLLLSSRNIKVPSASHLESQGLLQLASSSKALPRYSSIGADFSLWFILNRQYN
jgi:hypothetical protein